MMDTIFCLLPCADTMTKLCTHTHTHKCDRAAFLAGKYWRDCCGGCDLHALYASAIFPVRICLLGVIPAGGRACGSDSMQQHIALYAAHPLVMSGWNEAVSSLTTCISNLFYTGTYSHCLKNDRCMGSEKTVQVASRNTEMSSVFSDIRFVAALFRCRATPAGCIGRARGAAGATVTGAAAESQQP